MERAKESDVVICPLATSYSNDMFEFYKAIQVPKTKIRVLIGTTASVYYKELLEDDICDFVCIGEPELTLKELCMHLSLHQENPYIPTISVIAGISYKKDGKVVVNKPREFIKELDSLPFPNREILDNSLYTNQSFLNKASTLILTSRGCPFSCNYCATNAIYSKRWRVRSPQNVVSELAEIYFKHKIKNVFFMDDTFTVDKKRVLEICKLINENKLKIRWVCLTRPDCIDEEMLRAMKSAGCVEVRLGVESGSQKILDNICKGVTLAKIREACNMLKKVGITQSLFFMLGNPREDEKTIEQTIRFAIELNPDYVSFNLTTLLPGSKLHEEFAANKTMYSLEDLDTEKAVISICKITTVELKKRFVEAYKRFYLRPRYFWKVLKRIIAHPSFMPFLLTSYYEKYKQVSK